MSEGPTIVKFKREGWREAVQAIKAIVGQLESGELPPIEVGALVTISPEGQVEVFGLGPKADPLQVLGLLRLGERRVMPASR